MHEPDHIPLEIHQIKARRHQFPSLSRVHHITPIRETLPMGV